VSRRLIFFDFIYSYGGAQQATALLLNKLSEESCDIRVRPIVFDNFDARFLKAVSGLNPLVLGHPNAAHLVSREPSLIKFFIAYVFGFIRFLPALRSLVISGQESEFVLTNSIKGLIYLVAARVFLRSRFRILFYVRGSGSESSLGRFGLALARRCVDSFLCVSEATKAALVRRRIDPERCAVTYTTIDWSVAPAGDMDASEVSSGVVGGMRLLYAASIIENKGLDKLLNALARLRTGIKIHLIVAGDVPYESHRWFFQRCKELSQNLPPNITVEWLGWVHEMAPVISSADAVILLSNDEGLPRIIQEAMMQRRAVISTAVGGAPELVEDGVTGVICNEDPDSIVGAIERLSRSDISDMGRLGCEKLRSMLSPESQVALVKQILWS
jgi:glycosyltransferase involved in cell wall biosynthesis